MKKLRGPFAGHTIEWELDEGGQVCCAICHQPEPIGFVCLNEGDKPVAFTCGHPASVEQ